MNEAWNPTDPAPTHYHGSRPRYPGERKEGKGRVTVWLADLEKAQTWLSLWQQRASIAFYSIEKSDGTYRDSHPSSVCLVDRHTDQPRATVDGYEARVWPCSREDCTIGVGVSDG